MSLTQNVKINKINSLNNSPKNLKNSKNPNTSINSSTNKRIDTPSKSSTSPTPNTSPSKSSTSYTSTSPTSSSNSPNSPLSPTSLNLFTNPDSKELKKELQKNSLPVNLNPELYPEKYTSRFLIKPSNNQNNIIDLHQIIKLPNYIQENEWIATHVLNIFKNVFTVYETISCFCLPKNKNCREMAGVGHEKFYRNLNSTNQNFSKDTQDLTHASRYIFWVYEKCTKIIMDQNYFPTKYGGSFCSHFKQEMSNICLLLYSIISHMYYAHFIHMLQFDNLHIYLNQILAHLCLLSFKFNLLDKSKFDSLKNLIKFLLPDFYKDQHLKSVTSHQAQTASLKNMEAGDALGTTTSFSTDLIKNMAASKNLKRQDSDVVVAEMPAASSGPPQTMIDPSLASDSEIKFKNPNINHIISKSSNVEDDSSSQVRYL